MLEAQEALAKILNEAKPLKAQQLPVKECLGRVLARNLYAPLHLPAFDNSAVDGYAISSWEAKEEVPVLKVQAEISAGNFPSEEIQKSCAVRVFTGAPVPKGTRAVVMQENTERRNGSVLILKKPGDYENIRFKGEDIRKKDFLMPKGTVLGPPQLALLAAAGYGKVAVIPAPEVSILATGSELVPPGGRLGRGKIYDSNSVLLETLVAKYHGVPRSLGLAPDDPGKIRAALRRGLRSQMLLVSGGVSEGRHDYVKEVLKKEGVKPAFWKVNIKPGKPLFFGWKKETLVFGLPGNPVSAYITFEEFVKPALLELQGKLPEDVWRTGRLSRDFHNGPRRHFVRAVCRKHKDGYEIEPLQAQGSHMLASLAQANAILEVEPDMSLRKGQQVTVRMMDAL